MHQILTAVGWKCYSNFIFEKNLTLATSFFAVFLHIFLVAFAFFLLTFLVGPLVVTSRSYGTRRNGVIIASCGRGANVWHRTIIGVCATRTHHFSGSTFHWAMCWAFEAILAHWTFVGNAKICHWTIIFIHTTPTWHIIRATHHRATGRTFKTIFTNWP